MEDNKDSSNEDQRDSSLFSDEENIYDEFSERKKEISKAYSQPINISQADHCKAEITSKEISSQYKISPSQISKIKRTSIDQTQWGPRRNYTKLSSRENKLL